VLLSTHILPEVNMTCRRVVIIDKGVIVAQDTPENLTSKLQGSDQTLITVSGPAPAVREALAGVKFVDRIEDRPVDAGTTGLCSYVAISNGHGEEVRTALAACVVQHGWGLLEVKPMALSLEDLFMRLVTKEERVN
jgi:ABC-2 type transport system ATP-binding protein